MPEPAALLQGRATLSARLLIGETFLGPPDIGVTESQAKAKDQDGLISFAE